MTRNRTAAWIGGAVVLAMLLLAGAWTLLIGPRFEAAATFRADAENEQVRIDQLEIQLEGLKKDYEQLPAFEAELAALRVEMPAEMQLSDLTRQLGALAAESGVTILAMTPSTSIQLSAALAVPAPAAPAPDTAATDGTAAESTEAAPADGTATDGTAVDPNAMAPVTPVVSPNLYAIPIEIRTIGGYLPTLAFLDKFQTANPRLLLVRQVSLAGQPEAAAKGGRPAVAEGDPEMTIQAYAYVLVDPMATPEAPVDAELPAGGGVNPFQGGS